MKKLVLTLFVFIASFAHAQESGGGALQALVTDPTGAVVSGAAVTITNLETGYSRVLSTDSTGKFSAPALPVGSYAVEVRAPGFSPLKYENVSVRVGTAVSLNAGLQLFGIQQEISVEAQSELLSTDQTAASESIDVRAIEDLPIRGRNFTEFAQLTPAIVQESDRFGLVVSGQRSINSNVAIDGADFNDALQGNQRGGNVPAFFFPQTAVREFQVVRSGAGAEIGRTNAGFVNVVTKSGTNQVHGELFYFNRNKGLTSPDAFEQKLNNQQNQFGGSLGGPYKADKAFYFLAVEQNFLRVPFVVKFQQQAAGVTLPADLLAMQGEQHGTNNPTAFFFKNDFNLTARHSLNAQYTFSRMRGDNFNFDSPQQDAAASANYAYKGMSHSGKFGLTSVFSGSFLNELRGQAATDNRDEEPNSTVASIVITGVGSIGGDTGRPRTFYTTRYQVTDNVSWTSSNHQARFGFDSNINQLQQRRESNIQGRYDFRNVADYVAGRIQRYRQTLAGFDPEELIFTGTQKEFALFVEDKISLGRQFSLTAGLRWEGQWEPQPKRPNPAIPETASIPNDLKQWQPRLGLAWNGNGGKSVLRFSAGIFTARTPGNLFQRVSTDNGTTTLAVDSNTDASILALVKYPTPLLIYPGNLRVPTQRVFGFKSDFVNPRSFQTSATLEQVVGSNWVLSGSYLHSSTWNLQRRLDRNLFAPTYNAAGMPIYPTTRPNPSISIFSLNESSAHSRYDAMILALRKRRGRYEVQSNYTFARNLDDDSNERNFSRETTLDPFNLKQEHGYSKQDVRHNLTLNSLVDLGRGFSLSGILQTHSGFPFTPVIGSDTQNDGNADNDRAIINGRVAERNSMRQPSFVNLDLRALKKFSVRETTTVTFSLETFNVTRATNKNFANDSISTYGTPASPVATAGQPLFAPSTARFGGPRQVQLGLRLQF